MRLEGSEGHAAVLQPKRIPELDGVRGIAILLVLFWHYPAGVLATEPGAIGATLKTIFAMSFAGVDLFFVLSGYLIGSILFRQRQSPSYFTTFYARRFLRLMPLYLLVVGGYCLMGALSGSARPEMASWLLTGGAEVPANPIPAWSYLLYVQNFFMAVSGSWGGQWLAPTWSLAVEEQFYLLVPLLIWLLPDRRVPVVLGCLILAAPIFRIEASAFSGSIWPSYVLLPGRLDALFIGMLAAYYVREPAVDRWLQDNQRLLLRSLVVMMLGIVAMTIGGIEVGSPAMISYGHTFIALASLMVILAALYVDHPWLKAILRNRCLTWTGLVSYGIYLLHMPVVGLVALAIGTGFDAVVILVATLATFLLAAASWYLFEKPIITFGQRFKYDAPAAAAMPSRPTSSAALITSS